VHDSLMELCNGLYESTLRLGVEIDVVIILKTDPRVRL